MAYTKQTWENLPSTNSPITADRLNHIEDGIYNAYEINNSYSTSQTTGYTANYVNNTFQTKGTILWTNSSPTSSFTEQDITLSSSDYDMLEIFYNNGTSNTKSWAEKTLKGYGTYLVNIINLNEGFSQPTGTRSREVGYVNDTKLHFYNTLVRDDGTQASTPTVNNDAIIPLYVIGYKF